MERHGRFIHCETKRTESEQQSLMENLANSVDTLFADIEQRVQSIESQLQKFNTFTILGALTLQNHVTNPDTYKEYSHPGRPFVSEYATLLALKNPYSNGTEFLSILPVLHKVQEETEHVFQATYWREVGKYARRKIDAEKVLEDPTTLEELRTWMHSHELTVRNPAYEHHHHEVLKCLFQPFENELLSQIGFSIDDALALSRAISNRINRLFSERLHKAREAKNNYKKIVRKARRSGSLSIDKTDFQGEDILSTSQFYSELLRRSPEEVDRFLTSATLAWLLIGADDICSFTVDDLAKESSVSRERISNFLSSMSMNFGCLSAKFDIIPSPTHPLRERPFVHHEGRYLASAPMLIDWAIQPAFETALKNVGESVWQRYQKQRHDYVLNRSVDILQGMMPGASIGKNLLYLSKENKSSEAEIDAIAVYDGVVFLIEVKGANITAPALRGAPDRLRRDLEKVIAKSHLQALRAKNYITRDRESIFRRDDGEPDFILPPGIRDIVLISISLATMGHLTALLHADSDIGFFKNGEYSWVVSLYDLIVIGDIIELPPMFPHYVKRRVNVAHLGILEAHDELDLFGYYMNEGLYVDDIAEELEKESGKPRMSLLSYTGQFDEYYSYQYGSRRRHAAKPNQKIPYKMKKMIERLENSRLPGRVEAAMAILDLCHETRLSFLKGIEKTQKISLREHRISDVTVYGQEGGGWGLTYMCDRTSLTLEGSLRLHCNRKIEQMNYKKWLGFAETINRNAKVISICIIEK